MEFITSSPWDTETLGECLGKLSKRGMVLCLIGDLGVGKTEFVKGFAKGLEVADYITSPTFTIVNQYEGKLPLYHFDVYRINDVDEMYEIGYEEYIYGQGVCVIEWANLIEDILPEERVTVKIEKDLEEGLDCRKIKIETIGESYSSLIREMIEKCEF